MYSWLIGHAPYLMRSFCIQLTTIYKSNYNLYGNTNKSNLHPSLQKLEDVWHEYLLCLLTVVGLCESNLHVLILTFGVFQCSLYEQSVKQLTTRYRYLSVYLSVSKNAPRTCNGTDDKLCLRTKKYFNYLLFYEVVQ